MRMMMRMMRGEMREMQMLRMQARMVEVQEWMRFQSGLVWTSKSV